MTISDKSQTVYILWKCDLDHKINRWTRVSEHITITLCKGPDLELKDEFSDRLLQIEGMACSSNFEVAQKHFNLEHYKVFSV
eukprot:UN04807